MLGVVVDAYNKSVPINTEIEDKKTNLNLNNKNILLHICYIHSPSQKGCMGGKGVRQEPFDLDLGKKVGNLDFRGGVFWNFGFGLRKKSWKFGFWGGYSGTSDLDFGKKVGNLDFGGVFWNFGFGLRKKSWKFGFWGGGILELRIWT